jgi:polar amino acid transport system permease protein
MRDRAARSSQELVTEARQDPEVLGRRPNPLRWIPIVVVLVLLVMLGHGLAVNPAYQWHVVWRYLFNPTILRGGVLSIELTVICMLIAICLGTILAVMRLSSSRLLISVSWAYTWVFRSVPVLVQLIFWYNVGALYPRITFGVPFGTEFFGVRSNEIITRLGAAILGLGLAQAAYTGEIIRAGILSVDSGQTEAARALGMRPGRVLRRIILPQALRFVIPPLANEVVGMLKNTSLVSVISLAELFYNVQLIYSDNFRPIPLLIVACAWYLLGVSVLSIGQRFLERRVGRGGAGDRR